MNKKNFIIIVLILLVPIFMLGILSNKDKTMAEKQTSVIKPKIIKFSSQMCLDCKELKKNLEKVYPKYQNDIELIEIQVQENTPYNKQQIKKYNVTLVPTMIIIDKNGKNIKRIEGSVDKQELDKLMSDLVND